MFISDQVLHGAGREAAVGGLSVDQYDLILGSWGRSDNRCLCR